MVLIQTIVFSPFVMLLTHTHAIILNHHFATNLHIACPCAMITHSTLQHTKEWK